MHGRACRRIAVFNGCIVLKYLLNHKKNSHKRQLASRVCVCVLVLFAMDSAIPRQLMVRRRPRGRATDRAAAPSLARARSPLFATASRKRRSCKEPAAAAAAVPHTRPDVMGPSKRRPLNGLDNLLQAAVAVEAIHSHSAASAMPAILSSCKAADGAAAAATANVAVAVAVAVAPIGNRRAHGGAAANSFGAWNVPAYVLPPPPARQPLPAP